MYDVVCPVCKSMIEIPACAVESRGAHRCTKCWAWLKIVDSHPLRLEQGTEEMSVSGARTRTRSRAQDVEEDEDA